MAKVQILDQNENLMQELVKHVVDGSIKVDKTASDAGKTKSNNGVRRSFTLTLDNSDNALQIGWPVGIWLNNRVKLFTGFQYPDGTQEFVPQGVFILRQPKATSKPDESTITLQGDDKAALLNGSPGGTLADTWTITQGADVAGAIKTLCQTVGVTQFNFTPSSFSVPYTMTAQVGQTVWSLIAQLAWSVSWELFFDRNGYLVFRPQPDYSTIGPSVSFSTENPDDKEFDTAVVYPIDGYAFVSSTQIVPSDGSTPEYIAVRLAPGVSSPNPYMGTERMIDDNDSNSKPANHIVVIGGSSQTATVQAEAIDSSPNSATSTVTLGQHRVRVVQDPIITTQSQAQYRANYELLNSVIAAEKQTLSFLPNYLLDEEDVITLNDPNVNTNKNYVAIKLDIPLKWDGTMSVEAWEARNVLAQNNLSAVNG